mmetsp:Transcript_111560/g.356104  ORF Transcript_111560/g.356104 Transcript_111560/m.356104 type:complete len:249 (+) Transcript_111560:888-1634(+)
MSHLVPLVAAQTPNASLKHDWMSLASKPLQQRARLGPQAPEPVVQVPAGLLQNAIVLLRVADLLQHGGRRLTDLLLRMGEKLPEGGEQQVAAALLSEAQQCAGGGLAHSGALVRQALHSGEAGWLVAARCGSTEGLHCNRPNFIGRIAREGAERADAAFALAARTRAREPRHGPCSRRSDGGVPVLQGNQQGLQGVLAACHSQLCKRSCGGRPGPGDRSSGEGRARGLLRRCRGCWSQRWQCLQRRDH